MQDFTLSDPSPSHGFLLKGAEKQPTKIDSLFFTVFQSVLDLSPWLTPNTFFTAVPEALNCDVTERRGKTVRIDHGHFYHSVRVCWPNFRTKGAEKTVHIDFFTVFPRSVGRALKAHNNTVVSRVFTLPKVR